MDEYIIRSRPRISSPRMLCLELGRYRWDAADVSGFPAFAEKNQQCLPVIGRGLGYLQNILSGSVGAALLSFAAASRSSSFLHFPSVSLFL